MCPSAHGLTKSAPFAVIERVAFPVELLLIGDQFQRRTSAVYTDSWKQAEKKTLNTYMHAVKLILLTIYDFTSNFPISKIS